MKASAALTVLSGAFAAAEIGVGVSAREVNPQ